MTEALLLALGTGLTLWKNKDARRYQEKHLELARLFYAENNKPDGERDDSIVDLVDAELRILSHAFSSQAGKPKDTIIQ